MAREFAEVFASLRTERRLSQRRVAEDLGVSQALLSHYEKGIRQPRFDFVVRACKYYGVSADYMLGITESPLNPATAQLRRSDGTSSLLLQDPTFRKLLRTSALTAKLLRETYGPEAETAFYRTIAAGLFGVLRLYQEKSGCPLFPQWEDTADEALLPMLQQLAELQLRRAMPPTDTETPFPWDKEEAEYIRSVLDRAEQDFRELSRYYHKNTGE